jgi:hypothetical protein
MSGIQIRDGIVETQARATCTRLGQWVLVCDVRLAPATPPITSLPTRPTSRPQRGPGTVQVRKSFGTGEAAAQACRTRAGQMRPGVRVNVGAQGATGRIVLDGVTDLQLPDLYDYHAKVAP